MGQVIPPLAWSAAYKAVGALVEDFSLEKVYCDPEYADVETIIFISSAEWCPNCPNYLRFVQTFLPALAEANALIVWVEVQDNNFNPASSLDGWRTFDRIFDDNGEDIIGMFVGDKDMVGGPVFNGNSLVQAFPSQFVVRKRDMRVIHGSIRSDYLLPLLQLARHPEADWDNPTNNTLPTNVGEPCASDAACDTGTLLNYCLTADNGYPDGYCTGLTCANDAACGEGNICATVDQNGLTACFKGCADATECRTGFECTPLGDEGSAKACQPPA
jgi:hypothetical protein